MYKQFYVYIHKLPDGTPFYVGMGKNKRAYDKWNRGIFWHAVVKKHCPQGPCVELVATSLTQDEAIEIEIALIWYYGRRDLKNGTLVNLTDGGDHAIPGPETRAKLSQSAKARFQNPEQKAKQSQSQIKRFQDHPEQRAALSHHGKTNPKCIEARLKATEATKGKPAPNRGISASDATKAKQSQSGKTRFQNPEQKEAVLASLAKAREAKLSKPYEFKPRPHKRKPILCHQNGIIYESGKQASIALLIEPSKVCLVAQGKRSQTKGYTFSYV